MRPNSFLKEIFDSPIAHLKLGRNINLVQNREALKLYRDVLKFSKEFFWLNDQNQQWGEMIRRSARKEFELARNECDPLLCMKMIVTSREAMQKTREKLNIEYHRMNQTFSDPLQKLQ